LKPAAEDVILTSYPKEYLDFYKLIDVEVLMDKILHSSDSDLIISIIHEGITDTLINMKGGDGDNFINTRLFDASPDLLSSGGAAFTGSFKPENPMSAFAGHDPNGEWKLRIYDGSPGNTGTLKAWSLKLYFAGITDNENITAYYSKDLSLQQNLPIHLVKPQPFPGNCQKMHMSY